ncbi:MAG: XVIPCD domain-containing protein [Silanimonas sp.]
MTDPAPENTWRIEARALPVVGIAAHDFWVLRDPSGKAVAELHGLATERATGLDRPIGTDSDAYSLRAWHFVRPEPPEGLAAAVDGPRGPQYTYIGRDQPHVTVASGSREDVLSRWNAAVGAIDTINRRDLDYPVLGVNPLGGTVNSNSMYRTFGEIMNVPVVDFPGRLEPGLDQRTLSPKQIEQFRNQHGQPAPPVPPRNAIVEAALDPRYRQIETGVAALDAQHGRTPDVRSERIAQSLYTLGRENDFRQIDHVVASIDNGRGVKAGENLFIVQGRLDDPAHQRAMISTAEALQRAPEENVQRLAAVEAQERTEIASRQAELARGPAIDPTESTARRVG